MNRRLEQKEAEALRAVLARERAEPAPEEFARAACDLAPAVDSAARRLIKARAERRSLRLQAWGLAACMALFVSLMWLTYEYRHFLLATPARWGPIAAFMALSAVVTGCLPLLLKKEGEKKHA